MIRYIALFVLFAYPFRDVASDADCIASLKKVLFAQAYLNDKSDKCYRLAYSCTSSYTNPKTGKKQSYTDKCMMILGKDKVYFKSKDVEYFKTKNKIVCLDHTEHVIFASSAGNPSVKKIEQYNTFLSDSILSKCKVEQCRLVNPGGSTYSITLIPTNKRNTNTYVNKITYIYDTEKMVIKEYHVSYRSGKGTSDRADYYFTSWYTMDKASSMADLISMYKRNKLKKQYPGYRVIESKGYVK